MDTHTWTVELLIVTDISFMGRRFIYCTATGGREGDNHGQKLPQMWNEKIKVIFTTTLGDKLHSQHKLTLIPNTFSKLRVEYNLFNFPFCI